jgi:hypothetical protein
MYVCMAVTFPRASEQVAPIDFAARPGKDYHLLSFQTANYVLQVHGRAMGGNSGK